MTNPSSDSTDNINFTKEVTPAFAEILTPEAVKFIIELEKNFGARQEELLQQRALEAQRLKNGGELHFLPETEAIRQAEWDVAPIPKDLRDRRVEITGPAERKMIINALNSGAKVFMADIEDALSPSWENVVNAQIDLRDAVNKTISFTNEAGKHYQLNEENLAVLIVRPRGLHLYEKHVELDGRPVHGALFDFGLYFYHNAKQTLENGSGPYFYLPKLEHYKEAQWWNDVFVLAQQKLGLPVGTIKATVLIETINAAFQMDEILYALQDHIVAQNAGRWDYIFSYIKKHADRKAFICPERGQVTMEQHFLRSYSQLLIQTCHKRGAMAMGGMSAFIPIKEDEEANDKAMAMVRKDKEREAGDGHDGTWVAHPALIPIAREVFDRLMPEENQLDNLREDVQVTEADLLQCPTGTITEKGVRNNISVGIQYTAAWLRGQGCVPIFNLMEDAATAEISRTQIWQWMHHKVKLEDGRVVSAELYDELLEDELQNIQDLVGKFEFSEGRFDEAAELFSTLVKAKQLEDFLTQPAYAYL